MKKLLPITLFVLFFSHGYAQTMLDTPLSNIGEEEPLADFLIRFEKSHDVKFFYMDEWLQPYTITKAYNGYTLKSALEELLRDSDIHFSFMFGYAVIFVKDPKALMAYNELLRKAVAEKKSVEARIIGDPKKYQPGQKLKVKGTVKQESSGNLLAGVSIWVNDKETSVTETNGTYQLTLTSGENVVSFRYFNFREKVIDLKIYADGTLNIELEETPIVLDEVIISDQAVLNRRVSQTTIKMIDLKRAPTFLGEVDIIKQIQNQPGVTTVGEVASGFNVRGGGVDQNLVLYDGVPVFNTSHALGFFSAFNADAVSQASFYKGGIPAEYGGRVSSVLDIVSKEGPRDKWHGGGGIGIISSYLTVGGPIKRDTTTLIASVRGSYSDWMLKTIRSEYQNIRNSSLTFYDGSIKLVHKLNAKSRILFSGYTSLDNYRLTNDTLYSARNIAASLRFDHTFSDKLFGSLTLGFGSYSYRVREEDPATASDLEYGITYPSLKLDFNYEGTHKLSFGFHNTFYAFTPGTLKPTTAESSAREITMEKERSVESALYFSDAFYWRENLLLEGGLRLSIFNRVGPGTVYQYEAGKPMETRNIVDSTRYGSGEIMKTYLGLEPRLSARYILNATSSIKLGYNRMYQYMHLISNTAAVTPIDVWQSSNTYFKPQIGDQVSVGYYRSINDNMFEAYTEVFYKIIQNVLDFKDGANLVLNKYPETSLIAGKGEAYGAEFSVSKVKGRLLGTVSYTYSRSWRKTDGAFSQEQINEGEKYPSNYDQPHVAQVNWRYGISRRIFFSGTFVYHTGRPMSLPVSSYSVDGVPILNFSERNTYRIPDYHRLDLAFIIEGNHKKKKLWDGTWVVSFYNVYSRKNTYSVFFKDNGNGYLRPYKLSVVGSIVPSLTYSFKF